MAEGSVFFAGEPILRITAPLPQAQLVETRLINILHYQTLIASKAARIALLAPDKLKVDFGLRRAHGADAGLMAARASYIAGFDGTATLLAEQRFGIPTFGTMAHSYIEAHDTEAAAFERFARARPDGLTLLLDTYDTEAAARRVVALAPGLAAQGIAIRSVRLDSGDLGFLSRAVRRILDKGGLSHIRIFASGGLDEDAIAALIADGAPIDGWGVGTALTTSSDAPALDCAYKLEEYAGRPRRKQSMGKATWPGRKQVWRRYGPDGLMEDDILSVEGDTQVGEKLIRPVMSEGRRLAPAPALASVRARAADELRKLPSGLRRLDPHASYAVQIGEALKRVSDETDAWLAARAGDKP
jgi:nicotinate phosphoribosyltransferase